MEGSEQDLAVVGGLMRAENDALAGFVFSRFRAADFLKAILAIKNTTDVDISLYDGQVPTRENLIHDTATVAAPINNSAYRPFRAQINVEIAGRTWTSVFTSRPEFAAAKGNSQIYVVVGGALISLLLFGLTHSQVKARAATERTASELQISERKVRKTLSDRERAEERWAHRVASEQVDAYLDVSGRTKLVFFVRTSDRLTPPFEVKGYSDLKSVTARGKR